MVEMMLRPVGHHVILAASGEEALGVLEQAGPFDLVITDVSMGSGMTGWDLAARIRERWPELPVVLASGWGAQINPEEARSRGVARVLAKPFRMAELRDAVDRLG
jgi:CheY-like chemotaxis protein